MKKFLLVLISSVSLMLSVSAQDQTLTFVYIAHDNQTPVSRLCDVLQEYYDAAVNYDGYRTIFYLSNEDQPFIVEVNTSQDNRGQFERLLNAIQVKNSHYVNPYVDVREIVKLFNREDFVTSTGALDGVSYVDWCFYVTPRFWKSSDKEIIQNLCFAMETDKMDSYNIAVKVYYSEQDDSVLNDKNPFGDKNYCGINQMCRIYTY